MIKLEKYGRFPGGGKSFLKNRNLKRLSHLDCHAEIGDKNKYA